MSQGDLGPGSEFAGHRIDAELGRGGMGVVYLARHLALDRLRALKVLAPELSADRTFAERFRRESRLAAAIEHPNVVTIHHAGEERGRLYLAMSYIEGTDLHRVIEAGPVDPARVGAMVGGVGDALDAAHAHGLIHRDVKPANILIGERPGEGEVAFLTDFGISKLAVATDAEAATEAALTSTGAVLGTTDYISPEQIEGKQLTGAADTYALACVAFHALTGEPPFRRETQIATMMAHARAERPSASGLRGDLPPEVDRVLAEGMAIDPADRPATAAAFVARMADAIGGVVPADFRAQPTGAPATGAGAPADRAWSRGRLALAGLLALVAAAAVAALVLGGDDGPTASTTGGAPGPAPVQLERVKAVATIPTGAATLGVSAGKLEVWAASRDDGRISGIAPDSEGIAIGPLPLAGASAIATGHDAIWVVADGLLVRLDPAEGGSRLTVPGITDAVDVATDDAWVWVTQAAAPGAAAGELVRVDPSTNSRSGDAPVGADPRAVATGAGSVWVANAEAATVTRVDPGDVTPVGRPIPAGSRPTNIAVGAGSVWVTDVTNSELLRIDPSSDAVVGDPIGTGSRPRGVAVGFGSVWVANGEDNTVWEFDPRSGEQVGQIHKVGREPADIDTGFSAVWTANDAGGSISRIDP